MVEYCDKTYLLANHFVYQARDEYDIPIYIGVTNDIERRIKEHKASAYWPLLAHGLYVASFSDRKEAEEEETRMIHKWHPEFNRYCPLCHLRSYEMTDWVKRECLRCESVFCWKPPPGTRQLWEQPVICDTCLDGCPADLVTIGWTRDLTLPPPVRLVRLTDNSTAYPGKLHREMTTGEPSLRLFSSSLLSKWGFNDGDTPDEWFDYLEDQGIDPGTLRSWRNDVLPALVRRFLVPVLDQHVELVKLGTNHNPIRASKINGRDVEHLWHDDLPEMLTPEFVEIPFSEVLKIARYVQGEVIRDPPAIS